MHEFGLCEGIVETVLERAAGRPVSRVRVRIGVRHAAFAEPMAQAFEMIAAGTEAAGATLEIVAVPVGLTCRDCHSAAETADLLAVCPACGGDQVDLEGGDELTLVEIEYTRRTADGNHSAGTTVSR